MSLFMHHSLETKDLYWSRPLKAISLCLFQLKGQVLLRTASEFVPQSSYGGVALCRRKTWSSLTQVRAPFPDLSSFPLRCKAMSTSSNPLSSVVKYSDYGEVYCTTLPEINRHQLVFVEKIGQGEFGEVCRSGSVCLNASLSKALAGASLPSGVSAGRCEAPSQHFTR